MYYVRFSLTYLPTQKLDILYGRSLTHSIYSYFNLSLLNHSLFFSNRIYYDTLAAHFTHEKGWGGQITFNYITKVGIIQKFLLIS